MTSAEIDAVAATERGPFGLTRSVLVALASVYLIWSSTYYAVRVAVTTLPPFWMGGSRYLLAGLILLGFAKVRGEKLPSGRGWLHALGVGLLLCVMGNGFVSYASREIGSGVIAIVCGTMPLWGALFGRFLGAAFSRRELVGVTVGLVALVLLASGGDLTGSPASIALLMLAPVGWAIGSLWARRVDLGSSMGGSGAQMTLGGLGLLVISFVSGEPVVPPPASTTVWLAFVYLVVAGSLVGFVAYQYLLQKARPALAMSYAYVNPVLAVVLGAAIGGESLSMRGVLALGLISLAVVAIVMKPKPVASAR